MKINKLYYLIICVFIAFSCQEEQKKVEVPPADEVKNMDKISNSSLIHNPVTADEVIRPEDAAKIQFEETSFDFGDLVDGDIAEHVFTFKNVGASPLIISHAKAGCGCTVPQWPRSPILPGESNEIKVVYNSKGKKGVQNKTVTVTANTVPNETTIEIKANVLEN